MIALPTLLKLLNENYLNRFNTLIIGGFEEPFYLAHKHEKNAEIQCTHDYIRSALHELSHWCVAGVERRKLDDFGYWYAEDGRNQQQQQAFFEVELKPQAIEWAFSIVSGVKFEASADNLLNKVDGIDVFKQNLHRQLETYLSLGFSQRVTDIIHLIAADQKISKPLEYIKKRI